MRPQHQQQQQQQEQPYNRLQKAYISIQEAPPTPLMHMPRAPRGRPRKDFAEKVRSVSSVLCFGSSLIHRGRSYGQDVGVGPNAWGMINASVSVTGTPSQSQSIHVPVSIVESSCFKSARVT
mmetsp:Transcript_6429/g.11835  ORF Transcript_6429/g.11835 Transcript_6429/m.11835 type:complete len:122 (+) Transcript_6429:1-366(+)